jgi:hypothetical protein
MVSAEGKSNSLRIVEEKSESTASPIERTEDHDGHLQDIHVVGASSIQPKEIYPVKRL